MTFALAMPIGRSRRCTSLAVGASLLLMLGGGVSCKPTSMAEPQANASIESVSSEKQSRVRYVRPGGDGARDGSDWANALSGLPPVLERGTVYWLGAGSYGSYDFDDRPSGATPITVRKATASAHGTDMGWNGTYGRGQAEFGPLRFESDHYILDGGEPNGIRTTGKMGTDATVHVGANHILIRRVEIDGGLLEKDGKQIAGGCNGSNVHGDYVVFDQCELHNIADDGLGIYSSHHIEVMHSKIHGLHACGTDAPCRGPCYNGHSDGIEISDVSDIELVGNMVYDVRSTAAIFLDNWSGSKVRDLVAYNNVFYTPATGITVYLHRLDGARFYNNVIWGRTQGDRFGGLAIGKDVTDLQMQNNIILNINYSLGGTRHDPSQHRLDYNLFGMINSREYQANTNDLVANPEFAGIPMSADPSAHEAGNVTLTDFVPGADEAIDSAITVSGIPARDIRGRDRPRGHAWDRGPFEVR